MRLANRVHNIMVNLNKDEVSAMAFTAYDFALVPIIIVLVEVIGGMGVPSRFLPAVALALGLAGGFVYIAPDDPAKAVLSGIVMGLSAIGTYSGVKNTIGK